jgi:hypothetical protein
LNPTKKAKANKKNKQTNTMASAIRSLFRRKKATPLACTMHLDDPSHVHGSACFVDIQPLSVVELFQSQGCQSCPPAIPKILENVASDPNTILLTYNVTYFDHLGWKDTHANKQWDTRQRSYVEKWGRNTIFTPMVVVDGVSDGTGAASPTEVKDLITSARTIRSQRQGGQAHIALDTDGLLLKIDSDLQQGAEGLGTHDVVLIAYEPKSENVKVGKGPNKGKKLEHRNIVKSITKIGEWNGGHAEFPLPAPAYSGTENVVIVQAGGQGGAIVAAQSL